MMAKVRLSVTRNCVYLDGAMFKGDSPLSYDTFMYDFAKQKSCGKTIEKLKNVNAV